MRVIGIKIYICARNRVRTRKLKTLTVCEHEIKTKNKKRYAT